MLGAMVRLNTLGNMQVKLQVGSDHPSDWIQDPSAWRTQVLGAMVRLNTLGDMQVRFQVGSNLPSDWIQDPRVWSHGQTEHSG